MRRIGNGACGDSTMIHKCEEESLQVVVLWTGNHSILSHCGGRTAEMGPTPVREWPKNTAYVRARCAAETQSIAALSSAIKCAQ